MSAGELSAVLERLGYVAGSLEPSALEWTFEEESVLPLLNSICRVLVPEQHLLNYSKQSDSTGLHVSKTSEERSISDIQSDIKRLRARLERLVSSRDSLRVLWHRLESSVKNTKEKDSEVQEMKPVKVQIPHHVASEAVSTHTTDANDGLLSRCDISGLLIAENMWTSEVRKYFSICFGAEKNDLSKGNSAQKYEKRIGEVRRLENALSLAKVHRILAASKRNEAFSTLRFLENVRVTGVVPQKEVEKSFSDEKNEVEKLLREECEKWATVQVQDVVSGDYAEKVHRVEKSLLQQERILRWLSEQGSRHLLVVSLLERERDHLCSVANELESLRELVTVRSKESRRRRQWYRLQRDRDGSVVDSQVEGKLLLKKESDVNREKNRMLCVELKETWKDSHRVLFGDGVDASAGTHVLWKAEQSVEKDMRVLRGKMERLLLFRNTHINDRMDGEDIVDFFTNDGKKWKEKMEVLRQRIRSTEINIS